MGNFLVIVEFMFKFVFICVIKLFVILFVYFLILKFVCIKFFILFCIYFDEYFVLEVVSMVLVNFVLMGCLIIIIFFSLLYFL